MDYTEEIFVHVCSCAFTAAGVNETMMSASNSDNLYQYKESSPNIVSYKEIPPM